MRDGSKARERLSKRGETRGRLALLGTLEAIRTCSGQLCSLRQMDDSARCNEQDKTVGTKTKDRLSSRKFGIASQLLSILTVDACRVFMQSRLGTCAVVECVW